MHRFGNAGGLRGAAACQECGFGRDRLDTAGVRKQPFGWSLGSPIGAEQFEQLGREQSLTVFASLALAHPQRTASGVDFELGDFANTESAAIQRRQQSPVAKRARRIEQRLDFFPAQNERQLPLAPWVRDAFNLQPVIEGLHRHEWQLKEPIGTHGNGYREFNGSFGDLPPPRPPGKLGRR